MAGALSWCVLELRKENLGIQLWAFILSMVGHVCWIFIVSALSDKLARLKAKCCHGGQWGMEPVAEMCKWCYRAGIEDGKKLAQKEDR